MMPGFFYSPSGKTMLIIRIDVIPTMKFIGTPIFRKSVKR